MRDIIDFQPITLSEKKKEQIQLEILDVIRQDEDKRQVWLNRRIKHLGKWDDYSSPIRYGKYDSISNVHIPITEWMTQALHSYFLNIFFGSSNPFSAKPREGLDEMRLKRINLIFKWVILDLANRGRGIFESLSDTLWNATSEGWGFSKLMWEIILRNVAMFERVDMEELAQEAEAITEVVDVEKDEQGQEEIKDVRYKQTMKVREVFNGPIIECVQNSDILIPGSTCFPGDINAAKYVCHYVRFSEDKIESMIKNKILWSTEAKEVLEKGEDKTDAQEPGKQFVKKQDQTTGIQTDDRDGFLFMEIHKTMDIDDDGIDEDVVLYVHVESQKICGACHLNMLLPTDIGRRPFYQYGYYRRPGRSTYRGVVETLYPLQRELSMLHSMTIDNGVINNTPMGFYRPGSGFPEEPIKMEPGVLFPLERPRDDVAFPQRPQAHTWSSQLEGQILQYAQKVSFVNDLQLGGMPNPVGGARSTSGMKEMSSKFAGNVFKMVKNMTQTYEIMLSDMWNLVSDRLPIGTAVRVGAISEDPALSKVNKEDLAYSVDVKVTANPMNSDKDAELETAMMYMNMFGSKIALDLGIVTAANMYNVFENILEKRGEININRYITEPKDAQVAWTVVDELKGIVQGLKAPIIPNDKHEMKLEGISLFVKSEEFKGAMDEGKVAENWEEVYQYLMEGHTKMVQMMKAQEQQSNQAGMQAPMQKMGGNPNGSGQGEGGQQQQGGAPAEGAGQAAPPPSGAPGVGGAGGGGGQT